MSLKSLKHIPEEPGTYLIVDKDNTCVYIGSSNNLHVRAKRHVQELRSNKHHNLELQKTYNEKGDEQFDIVPCPAENLSQARDFEQSMLNEHYHDPGVCNLAIDARAAGSGRPMSSAHKAKLREYLTGREVPEETRRAISESLKGRKLDPERAEKFSKCNLGRKFSEEHKQKISEALKGKAKSEEAKSNMSKAAQGRTFSIEHMEKVRQANTNRPVSDQQRQQFIEKNQQAVIVNGKEYPSITEARNSLGLTPKAMEYRLNSDKYPEYKRKENDE